MKESFVRNIPLVSGVTRVGVTRCGNWRCHPIFLLKSDDLFSHGHQFPLRFPSDRLSNVLRKFRRKKIRLIRVSPPPGWCHPGGLLSLSPFLPSDATASSKYVIIIFLWVGNMLCTQAILYYVTCAEQVLFLIASVCQCTCPSKN